MRSLFIRIFLWFWAATVLLVAVLMGTIYLTEPETQPPVFRSLTHNFLSLYGRGAAAAYEQGGCAAMDEYLAKEDPFPSQNLSRVLIGQDGQGLCGATVTADERRAAARTAPPPRRPHRPPPEFSPSLLLSSHVAGPSGKRYTLVFKLPRLRPPRFAVPISTWVVRGLAVFITAGLVCYGLARHFATPIRCLREVTQSFASGDLKTRVGDHPLTRRRDEVAELARDFDDMAERIEQLVTRQEQSLQWQRRLLGDISHELRSPLTRLALASGLLQRKVSDDAKPLLGRIDRESERLNTLIGHLLTLARLDAGPAPQRAEKVVLNSLINDIVNDAAFEAVARRVTIEFNDAETCVLKGQPDLLHSAFENVLRNAIRYTAEGTSVSVELQKTDMLVSVIISDHGPGVPEKDLPHLFEPFYRVAESRDRQSGGTGLGLAIAERTMKLHGGSIAALNRPKSGLSVCMTFPASLLVKSETQASLSSVVS